MKTMLNLISSEFEQWGYSCLKKIDDCLLYGSTVGYDYWIVCSNVDVLSVQKKLYDNLINCTDKFDYLDKNMTLLLLIDTDSEYNVIDTIKVENNKSYFKKFVLRYSTEAVEQLNGMLEANGVDSIAHILLSEQCFNNVKNDSGAICCESLLYSIAHKLPFIPVESITKERKPKDFHFSSKELCDLFEWVQNAPIGDREIENYINQLIK